MSLQCVFPGLPLLCVILSHRDPRAWSVQGMEQFLSLLHDPDPWKIDHITCSTCCGFGMTVRNKHLVLLWGDLTSFLRPDFFFLAVWALSLCLAGLVASQLVGSLVPWTRDWTHTSCIGKRILNHWTAREVPLRPLHEQSVVAFALEVFNWNHWEGSSCVYPWISGVHFWAELFKIKMDRCYRENRAELPAG